jgi:hypothetical protein
MWQFFKFTEKKARWDIFYHHHILLFKKSRCILYNCVNRKSRKKETRCECVRKEEKKHTKKTIKRFILFRQHIALECSWCESFILQKKKLYEKNYTHMRYFSLYGWEGKRYFGEAKKNCVKTDFLYSQLVSLQFISISVEFLLKKGIE